jgi:hypothetical protein
MDPLGPQQRAVQGVFITGELLAVASTEPPSMSPRSSISFAWKSIFADELHELFGPLA